MRFGGFKKKKNRNAGFGIMEVVVSTAIVSFALVGVMSLFAFNMRVEIMNRNKVAAAYLAQEAIEVVRQKRDNNWFTSQDWKEDIRNGSHLCLSAIDYNDVTKGWDLIEGASESSYSDKQKIYLVNGEYVQTAHPVATWKDTGLRRLINISEVGGDKMKIVVTIYYNDDVLFTVTSYLYNNWY
ncbi:MAG: type II secretion system protein [Candidatus Paceibacterota bacterium]